MQITATKSCVLVSRWITMWFWFIKPIPSILYLIVSYVCQVILPLHHRNQELRGKPWGQMSPRSLGLMWSLFLNWTPIIDWHMARLVRYMLRWDWSMCPNMFTVRRSTVNTIGRGLCVHLKIKGIFTFTYKDGCISNPILKFEMFVIHLKCQPDETIQSYGQNCMWSWKFPQ